MDPAADSAAARLVVVDATGYLFRSFHALREMRTRDGRPSNAVYGMATQLASIRDDLPGAAFACVMDAPGKTFRHEMYPEYKATRKETDPDLIAQIEPTKRLIVALGMQLYCVAEVEADDVMATLARQAIAAGQEVYVATSDKDMMYLAGEGCRIMDPKTRELIDAEAVQAKFGVPPGSMLDYLTLIGDTVDNVPGVPGVGKKTAARWLAEHGSLDEIVAKADSIKGKVGEKLRAAVPQLELSKSLIRLREDVEVDPAPDRLAAPQADAEAVAALCEDYRFNPNLQQRLLAGTAAASQQRSEIEVEVVTTAGRLQEVAEQITAEQDAACQRIGLHAETDGMDAPSLRLVGLGVYAGKHCWYVPLAHGASLADANAEPAAVREFLETVLACAELEICCYQTKPLVHALRNEGYELGCELRDVSLMAYSQDSTASGELDAVSRRFLDYPVPARKELVGGRGKPASFAELEVDTAAAAAGQWAQAVLELRVTVARQMLGEAFKVFRDIEKPVVAVLADMEQNGVALDTQLLASLDDELRTLQAKLQEQIAAEVDKLDDDAQSDEQPAPLNLNSPQQLAELLYNRLGLDSGHKTRGGKLSTNETELERLAQQKVSPIPGLILEYRHAAKLSSTYTSVLAQRLNPATGRLHTRFIQAGAVTGRMASADPNLQNIPIRTETGRRIRECFVAPAGTVLVAADYSQVELRILAHFSGEDTLLEAFKQGEDVHKRTAAEIFGVEVDKVDDDLRRFAKTINFGLIYGMSAFGLAQRMDITRAHADELITSYFERMPKVREYLDELGEQASRDKVVKTALGRRIATGGSRRAAVNAPMQGTAADIMKLAMVAVAAELDRRGMQTRMLLQVHDELLLEVPDKEVDELYGWLAETMSGVASLAVPLEVDLGSGASWVQAH